MFTCNNQGIERTKCAADGARAEQERKPSWTFEYGLGRSHASLQQRERRRSGWHGDLKVDGNVVSTQKALRP